MKYLLDVSEEVYAKLEEIKKNTGAPIVYIIRRAIEEYLKILNKGK
jgi:predicted DNA-binding protein